MAQNDHNQNLKGREERRWQDKANNLPRNKFYKNWQEDPAKNLFNGCLKLMVGIISTIQKKQGSRLFKKPGCFLLQMKAVALRKEIRKGWDNSVTCFIFIRLFFLVERKKAENSY